MKEVFRRFAQAASQATGHAQAFILALLVVAPMPVSFTMWSPNCVRTVETSPTCIASCMRR